MNKRLSFHKLAEENLLNNSDWSEYTNNKGPMPEKHAKVLTLIAQFYFYIGDIDHAREVSYKSSIDLEKRAENRFSKGYILFGICDLFDSALYRSLAQKNDISLWLNLIEKRRQISEMEILEQNMAYVWVYEAYALIKAKMYSEVFEAAKKGFEEIGKGKSIYQVPSKNSREYGLANVLINLAEYQMNQTPKGRRESQKALVFYKTENFMHGRIGYDIIFDLQFSYPNILEPVLPSANPDED